MTTTAAAQLDIERVSVRRGDRLLLEDFTLAVSGGEIVHVRGVNGSGKTSLLRIIAGLSEPETGHVRWGGRDIREVRQAYGQDLVWYAHKDGLKNDLSVRENLDFHRRLYSQTAAGAIGAAADRLQVRRLLELPAQVLSAGQRRRVSLARLLLATARLWLLDEPFTNLDTDGAGIVRELIERHTSDGGLCVLASHSDPGFGPGRVRQFEIGLVA